MVQAKPSLLRLVALVILLLVPAFLLSPLLVNEVASVFLYLGFEETAYTIAKSAKAKEVSDEDLLVYRAMANLSGQAISKEDGNVLVYLPEDTIPKEMAPRVLEVFEQARKEISAYLAWEAPKLWVRAPVRIDEETSVGIYIDVPLHCVLSPEMVYHQVCEYLVAEGLLFFPRDCPVWFIKGLAEYVPSVLGKSIDFKLIKNPKGSPVIPYHRLGDYTKKTGDLFPACTAVALLDEVARSRGGLPALLKHLARGEMFIQALQRVCGISEIEFARKWEDSYEKDFLDPSSDRDYFLQRANELLDGERLEAAEIYLDRLSTEDKKSPAARYALARLHFTRGVELREEKSFLSALRDMERALFHLQDIETGMMVPKARSLETGIRSKLGKLRMLAAVAKKEGSRKLSHLIEQERSFSEESTPQRSTPSVMDFVFPPAIVLLVILFYLGLKYILFPLLFFAWSLATRSGGVLAPSIFLLFASFLIKLFLTLLLCPFQWMVFQEQILSCRALYLIYAWLFALIMWAVASRVFAVSGGEDPGDFFSVSSAFFLFALVLSSFCLLLWQVGEVEISFSHWTFWSLLHAVFLAFVGAVAQETFFRGGIFKSVELSLHVGSASIVSSLLYAFYATGVSGTWLAFGVTFVFGMFLCSLVSSSGRLGFAIGAVFVVNLFNWVLLGASGAPFGLGAMDMAERDGLWLSPYGYELSSLPAWLPVLFLAWCLTQWFASSRFGGDKRSSRIFLSASRY